AAFEFLQDCEDETGAGRADWMTEGDRATVDVEMLVVDFPERLRASQSVTGKFLRRETLQDGQRLNGERFVKFDQICGERVRAGCPFELVDGEDRSESHPHRIAAGVGVIAEDAKWREAELGGARLAHHEQGDSAISD